MKTSKILLFVLLIISVVLLASCGADNKQSEANASINQNSEAVTSEESSEKVSTDESISEEASEIVSEDESISKEISENVSEDESSKEESKHEGDIPYKNSEIYPGDDALIIYGDDFPLKRIPYRVGSSKNFRYTNNLKDLFDDPAYENAYYYVCIDMRTPHYIDIRDKTEELVEGYGLKVEEIGEKLFVTYATEGALEHLRENISEDYCVYLADRTLTKELWDKSYEGYIPFGSTEELSFNPPENAMIIYGEEKLTGYVPPDVVRFGGLDYPETLNEYFDDPAYDGAYYFVCFDTRISNFPQFLQEEIIAYYGSFGVACEAIENVYSVYVVYFAYVTEEQIKALADDRGLAPNSIVRFLHENAREEYEKKFVTTE